MMGTMRGWTAAAALALTVSVSGCGAGMGWDDVLPGGGYGYAGEVRGEVRAVNRRARTIELRTDRGRYERLRYDSRTDVRYRDRRYSPTALERGDYVVVRVARDSRGRDYARVVNVRRSGGERRVEDRREPRRRDPAYSRATLEGRVGRVDRREERIQLRGTRRGNVWVTLSPDASGTARQRLLRLREGQYVRLRGRFLSEHRFEVVGFR